MDAGPPQHRQPINGSDDAEWPDPLAAPGGRSLLALVDDEPDLVAMVTTYLTRDGFEVVTADGVRGGAALLRENAVDLLILDLGLPDGNGLDLLRGVRAGRHIPVLILSAWGTEVERVTGLELGADDYLVKPFSLPELAARIRAVLRRSYPAAPDDRLRYGDLRIDARAHEVTVAGRKVALTPLEYGVLEVLASVPRQVFSADRMLREVWGSDAHSQGAASVAEHVYRLRRKLAAHGGAQPAIVTVRGAGYRLDPP